MPYFDFIWELTEDGNIAHIAEHGLAPADVESIVLNPDRLGRESFIRTPDCIRRDAGWKIYCRGVRAS